LPGARFAAADGQGDPHLPQGMFHRQTPIQVGRVDHGKRAQTTVETAWEG